MNEDRTSRVKRGVRGKMAEKLSLKVETILAELAVKNGISPADENARHKLALLGEEGALNILKKISKSSPIKNLSCYIVYMVKHEATSALNPPTSSKSSQTSFNMSRDNCEISSAGGLSDDELSSIGVQWRHTHMHEDLVDSVRRKNKLPLPTEHLKALGKLDFPKAFLVLNYIGRCALEEVLSIKDIDDLQGLEIADAESHLRQVVAMRVDSLFPFKEKICDWDKAHEYHCYVDCEGSCVFKGPISVERTNHLQRVLGESNVLQVHFAEELLSQQVEQNGKKQSTHCKPNAVQLKIFWKMAKEGIFVGLRRYKFFAFKDGGKTKMKDSLSPSIKCYFVCTESFAESDRNSSYSLFNKSIHEARCMFMHAHTVSTLKKYMARFSLVLSKTICFNGDISSTDIKPIEDIPCMDEQMNPVYDSNGEPMIHTDGTGFISKDLASQCSINVYQGKQFDEDSEVCPLLVQCRLFDNGDAVKGTLLVNRELPANSIYIRRSMIKVERDPSIVGCQTIKSLNICGTSYKPKTANLSQYLIALLSYGGVPRELFIGLVKEAVDKIQSVFHDVKKALKVAANYMNSEEDNVTVRMLSCGIPLNEPFIQYKLKHYMMEEIKKFKKGKFPLDECFYLMGTADPTGQLKRNEVCVILDHGQVSGEVLVYKHPGIHFGDIHVFKATYIKDIEKIVGDSKYAIFFSTQGARSPADEIANSDFDGDLYWVSMNANLLKYFKPGTPWRRPVQDRGMPQPKPADFSHEELEEKLIEEYINLRFAPSYVTGIASENWLAFMDRLLTPGVEDPKERQTVKEKMMKLVDICYESLDAPKTGKQVVVPENLCREKKPHFQNKNSQDEGFGRFYKSSSILGEIYDLKVSDVTSQSDEIWTIPCFWNTDVVEFKDEWRKHYTQFRSEMAAALGSGKPEAPANIVQTYKKILYGSTNLISSNKPRKELYLEASALYQVVYEYAKEKGDIGKCHFAWRVAGEALCELYHLQSQNEAPILISPSILRQSFS